MKRPLVYYGNPLLHQKCAPITEITSEVEALARDLVDSVIAYRGAGLAAPQIGVLLQMFVICYEDGQCEKGNPILGLPKIYINPKLSYPSPQKMISHQEGCLSIPGLHERVDRPTLIQVEAMDLKGKIFREEATYWKARVIDHEHDHLNGMLFTEKLDAKRKKKIAPILEQIKNQMHT